MADLLALARRAGGVVGYPKVSGDADATWDAKAAADVWLVPSGVHFVWPTRGTASPVARVIGRAFRLLKIDAHRKLEDGLQVLHYERPQWYKPPSTTSRR
ncbi:procollagen-proline 4-dioxygenase [Aureococcus anophagefferens]|uniref:Procollagen-proline 4-dioxygenase n=1 Tax=Aureococcus anophagefferens TaxID=44056 RepID=A0ABR1FVW6_AURAN